MNVMGVGVCLYGRSIIDGGLLGCGRSVHDSSTFSSQYINGVKI